MASTTPTNPQEYSIRRLLRTGRSLETPTNPSALPTHPPRHAVAEVGVVVAEVGVGVGEEEGVEEDLDLRRRLHKEAITTAPLPRSLLSCQAAIPPQFVRRPRRHLSWRSSTSRHRHGGLILPEATVVWAPKVPTVDQVLPEATVVVGAVKVLTDVQVLPEVMVATVREADEGYVCFLSS